MMGEEERSCCVGSPSWMMALTKCSWSRLLVIRMFSAGQVRWCFWAPLVLLALVSNFPSKAQGQVPAPRRLRFKVLSSSKLLVSWKEPRGDFDSYLFLYNSIPGGQQREITLPKFHNKVLITDYNSTLDYTFSIIVVSGSKQSRPLQGRHKAEKGESDGGDETGPQRLPDSAVPPEDANKISGDFWPKVQRQNLITQLKDALLALG